jgi:hypothetical protein
MHVCKGFFIVWALWFVRQDTSQGKLTPQGWGIEGS